MNDRAVELEEREAELKTLQDKIEKSKRALDADSEQQTKEVSRLWQQLKDEYNRIENVYTVQKVNIFSILVFYQVYFIFLKSRSA